jgi:hypothetical protein
MLKKIFIFLTMIATGIVACGQNSGNYEVTTDILNVRAEPNPNGKIIGKLKAKQEIKVVRYSEEWSSIIFVNDSGKDENGYVKSKFIKPVSGTVSSTPLDQTSDNKSVQYVLWSVLAICFICYIIALIRTRQGKMITIVNWYDFTLLIAPFILWIIAALCMDEKAESNWLSVVLFVLGGLCFLGSMAWSVIANRGNVLNMIISIFAKLFVILIVWIIALYFLRGKKTQKTTTYNGHTYTRRLTPEEQELENERYNRNMVIAVGIATLLIISLIGSENRR